MQEKDTCESCSVSCYELSQVEVIEFVNIYSSITKYRYLWMCRTCETDYIEATKCDCGEIIPEEMKRVCYKCLARAEDHQNGLEQQEKVS